MLLFYILLVFLEWYVVILYITGFSGVVCSPEKPVIYKIITYHSGKTSNKKNNNIPFQKNQ
jgi:hypothetical protein